MGLNDFRLGGRFWDLAEDFGCASEIWLRVCCLGCWDSAEGLGFRVCGFDSEFFVWGFLIWRRIWHLGYWYLT